MEKILAGTFTTFHFVSYGVAQIYLQGYGKNVHRSGQHPTNRWYAVTAAHLNIIGDF